ncbi:hypothetical protein IQ07DRAFT_214987 [Pyrenochaeta sp. DS3sAY3a]|nr:hypothetical protein IQ07DRAFT_214987 [Pyrenochaeta sp. DS3sAY3a]
MIISCSPETGGVALCVSIWGRLLHALPQVLPRLNVNPSLTHHARGQNHCLSDAIGYAEGSLFSPERCGRNAEWFIRPPILAQAPFLRPTTQHQHGCIRTDASVKSFFDRTRPYERDPRSGGTFIIVIASLTYLGKSDISIDFE